MSEADAAAVASKLLDFYKEPARFRPGYLNGQEAIAGAWVFKFAQARFPHRILRAFNIEERRRLREAACAFIRQVCLRDAATHYDVLGVQPAAKTEALKENYHLLMALLHPDRQDAHAWPTGCAQRVNQAYAVLSDERQRRAYQASLQKIGSGAAHIAAAAPADVMPAVVARPMSPRRRRRSRIRAAMLVTAVIATLLFVQIAWVSDLPAEYGVLERAYPLELSTRWMRNVFSSSETPRFLTENAWSPRATDVVEAAPEPKPARRRPAPQPPAELLALSPEPAPPAPRPARTVPPLDASIAPIAPATQRLSLAADTSVQPAAAAPTITSADIETLVARLVSSYEAGDVDALMALVDRTEAASVRGARMRQAYDAFFRATRQRHLYVTNLAWQLGAGSAQARGEAALSAEFVGQAAALERRVPVEVDIALREGRARITRLALFPDGT